MGRQRRPALPRGRLLSLPGFAHPPAPGRDASGGRSLNGALLAGLLLASPARTAEVEVPRRVLVLHLPSQLSDGVPGPQSLSFHLRGELWLDRLGFEAEYLDATQPLPDPASLAGVRAVATWFDSDASLADPKPICRWLTAAMENGTDWVLLGAAGLMTPRKGRPPFLEPDCAEAYRALGIELGEKRPVDAMSVKLAFSDPAVMGFERAPDPSEEPGVPAVRLLPGATPFLTLEFKDGGEPRSDPVALTPHGGLALDPFLLYSNIEIQPHQYRWVTNPEAFLERALRAKGLPRPDATTLSGRRVLMVRVDGDGFFNRSDIDRKKFSGEVFLRQILEKRPDSPFNLSLIDGYYDMTLYRTPEALTLSRLVLNRPNVQPGSHGFAHPLVWSSGTLALNLPGKDFDAEREIAFSAADLKARFLPEAKSLSVFHWTGNCLPTEAQLKILSDAGLLGMNGGGGRFDSEFPSYSYLYPMTRRVGRQRQVYAGTYNENDFTGLWTGPYYGYRQVVETFKRAGSPRRVKPVDVYFHYYTAEKYAAMNSLERVLSWTDSQPLIPVWGARYIAAVRGFYEMTVKRAGQGRFVFEGGPALRTVRFDAEPRHPDLDASKGVVGFKRELGSLYVSLDENERREIVLSTRPTRGPWLEDANFEVSEWRREGGGLRFKKSGWRKAEATFAGLVPGRTYRLSCAGRDAQAPAGPDGRASFTLPDSERWRRPREALLEPVP